MDQRLAPTCYLSIRMWRWIAAGLLAVATMLSTSVKPAEAQFAGERFSSSKWRVKLVAPRRWKVSQQVSYPNILVWMTRQKAPYGKMLFAAEKIKWGTTALQYAKATEKLLARLNFQVRPAQEHSSGAFWIEFNNGRVYLQQAFLVNGNIGYTLTLATKSERQLRQPGRAYDATLRSISRKRVTAPPTVRPRVRDLRRGARPKPTPRPTPKRN